MPKPVRKMQKANAAAQAAVLPKIPPELLDQLVQGPMTAKAVDDVSRAFKKALIERALDGGAAGVVIAGMAGATLDRGPRQPDRPTHSVRSGLATGNRLRRVNPAHRPRRRRSSRDSLGGSMLPNGFSHTHPCGIPRNSPCTRTHPRSYKPAVRGP